MNNSGRGGRLRIVVGWKQTEWRGGIGLDSSRSDSRTYSTEVTFAPPHPDSQDRNGCDGLHAVFASAAWNTVACFVMCHSHSREQYLQPTKPALPLLLKQTAQAADDRGLCLFNIVRFFRVIQMIVQFFLAVTPQRVTPTVGPNRVASGF